jgi:hypothetical protein
MSIQLNLEVNEVQLLMAALGELPLKQGIYTWLKVRSQAEAQIQAQQAPAPAVDAAAPATPAAPATDAQPAE